MEPGSDESRVFNAIAEVFQNAQGSYVGHRRHVAVLNKIYLKCIDQNIAEVFHYWFIKVSSKILTVRKQEIVGDRIVRLIGAFIASNVAMVNKAQPENIESQEALEKTFNSLIENYVKNLLRSVESKNKHVRYRSMQLLTATMDNMGEIDEDLYDFIVWALKSRVYDKEPHVRIQAIFCLTKFQNDDLEISESEWDEAIENLVKMIRNDPSPEVRRAAMLNLVRSKSTQNIILERARDVNHVNRRLIYSRVLKSLGKDTFTEIDSRVIEQLLKWGFEDRDVSVNSACKKLVAFTWLNFMDGDIIELLENIDVTRSKTAEKVLYSLFEERSEVVQKISFPEEIWNSFTVETIFLLKCFYFYCLDHELISSIENNLPEAVRLAEFISYYVNKKFSNSNLTAVDLKYLDFIIYQLLEIASKYDFSDELGRRDVLKVVRNLLGKANNLNEYLISISLKLLKNLSINERDFISMSVEIINDIKYEDIERQELEERMSNVVSEKQEQNLDDGDDGDGDGGYDSDGEENCIESLSSAVDSLVAGTSSVEAPQVILAETEREVSHKTLMTCLTMSRHLLELISTSLDENIMLSSLIDTLITPAVRNAQPEIRELGVRCMGLCCLLDLQLATESMYILGMCVSKGNASLKHIALQVIVDIFSVHGTRVVDGEGKVDSISLHKIFYKILKNKDLPDCQSIAAEGLCKLFLGDVFNDDDLFETLVLSYFSPANSSNEPLIQAFAFCLPVYCFSHQQHQQRMSRIAADVLLRLAMLWDELQTSDDNDMEKNCMMKPNEIFHQLIQWCDPKNVVRASLDEIESSTAQIDFLLDVLSVFERFERKDVKKMLLLNVQKFYFTASHPKEKLLKIKEHLDNILEYSSTDKLSRTAVSGLLSTIQALLSKNDNEEKTSSEELTKNESEEEISESSGISSKNSSREMDSRQVGRGSLKRSRTPE